MQRKDVERMSYDLAREPEAFSNRAAQVLMMLLAERDAAFAAGQESMRERAALEAERGLASAPNRDGEMMQAIAEGIRDLPLKPGPHQSL